MENYDVIQKDLDWVLMKLGSDIKKFDFISYTGDAEPSAIVKIDGREYRLILRKELE